MSTKKIEKFTISLHASGRSFRYLMESYFWLPRSIPCMKKERKDFLLKNSAPWRYSGSLCWWWPVQSVDFLLELCGREHSALHRHPSEVEVRQCLHCLLLQETLADPVVRHLQVLYPAVWGIIWEWEFLRQSYSRCFYLWEFGYVKRVRRTE